MSKSWACLAPKGNQSGCIVAQASACRHPGTMPNRRSTRPIAACGSRTAISLWAFTRTPQRSGWFRPWPSGTAAKFDSKFISLHAQISGITSCMPRFSIARQSIQQQANGKRPQSQRTCILLSVHRENVWPPREPLVRHSQGGWRSQTHGTGHLAEVWAPDGSWARKRAGCPSSAKPMTATPRVQAWR